MWQYPQTEMSCKRMRKIAKMQEFGYRDTTNVEPKIYFIPVTNGATGILTKSLRKHLEAMPRKHSIDSLQKTALYRTPHIIRRVLQCEA
jgi:hypothetical protein